MNGATKMFLLIGGFLSALLIVSQLVMALMIVNGAGVAIRKSHQHSGYLMVVVCLLYIFGSLATIASIPARPKA